MAPLRYTENLIPYFPWIAPPALHLGAIQGKEGIKFFHLATLLLTGQECEAHLLLAFHLHAAGRHPNGLFAPEIRV